MVSWKRYLITVTLGSDLHCGDRPLGFVARSHPYVPAHIPWYATVAALVRLNELPDEPKSYQNIEEKLESCLRFSPFYIMDGEDLLYPWRSVERKRIQAGWLGSQYGVSLFYDSRGSRENQLFEMESILAISRSGKPTRLGGVCYVAMDTEMTSEPMTIGGHGLHTVIFHCLWGGQQNKGCGTLRNVEIRPGDNLPPEFGRLDSADAPCPVIETLSGRESVYPLRYEKSAAERAQGVMRPLTGRRFAPGRGPGLHAEPGTVVWEHGWRPRGDASLTLRFSNRRYAEVAMD